MADIMEMRRLKLAQRAARKAEMAKQPASELPKDPIPSPKTKAVAGQQKKVPRATKRAAPTDLPESPPPRQRRAVETIDVETEETERVEEVQAAGSSLKMWQRDGFVLPQSREACEEMMTEMGNVPPLSKINLHATEGPQVKLGRGVINRIVVSDALNHLVTKSPRSVANRAGLCLGELATAVAALDEISRQAISNEKESSQRAVEKEAELVKAMESLTLKEGELSQRDQDLEKMRLELASSASAVTSLQSKLSEREKEVEEQRQQLKTVSRDAKREAVKEFRSSDKFKDLVQKEILPYYDQGRNHILRMASAAGVQPDLLLEWATHDHYGDLARDQHPIIPFSPVELEVLKRNDARDKKPEWAAPEVYQPNLLYLYKVCSQGGTAFKGDQGWVVNLPQDFQEFSDEDETDEEKEADAEEGETSEEGGGPQA